MNDILKEYYGYNEFRPYQGDIIQSCLDGHDNLVLMATGSGKSICYQIPSLITNKTTIVISPLLSLITDQVLALKAMNIPCDYLSSQQQNSAVNIHFANGEYRIFYTTPETLIKNMSLFRELYKKGGISCIAIDEAHCLSEWGHDFRPSYRKLRIIRKKLSKVPIMALTATATVEVKNDIIKNLKLKNPLITITTFNRVNLSYTIINKTDILGDLRELLQDSSGSTIIYVPTRKLTEKITEDIGSMGFNVLGYHAGMGNKTRLDVHSKFIHSQVNIIVCTNSFGMGIDKPDIRTVIHIGIPKTLEEYYQQTGRAGRDGLPSKCIMFYNKRDFIMSGFYLKDITDETYLKVMKNKIQQMHSFIRTSNCLRKIILDYFNEDTNDLICNNCSNCIGNEQLVKRNLNYEIRLLLQVVADINQRYGRAIIIGVLTGGRAKKILDLQLNKFESYGSGKQIKKDWWFELVNIMINNKIIIEGQYKVLKFTELARNILNNGHIFPDISITNNMHELEQNNYMKFGIITDNLYTILHNLRSNFALQKSVPSHLIFNDKVLNDIVQSKPNTIEKLLDIQGINSFKAYEYGEQFIAAICNYLGERQDINNSNSERESDSVSNIGSNNSIKIKVKKKTRSISSITDSSIEEDTNNTRITEFVINRVTEPNLDEYLQMMLDGYDIVSIAKKYDVKISLVERKMLDYLNNGYNLPYTLAMNEAVYREIHRLHSENRDIINNFKNIIVTALEIKIALFTN
jgi:ATP-dependent DNA helicase RecQ